MLRRPWVLAPLVPWWGLTHLLADDSPAGPGVRALIVVLLVLAVVVAAGLVVWRVRWPDSFTRRVVWRARGVWRGRWVYRRFWQPAMATTGLVTTLDGDEYLPRLLRVASTGSVDRVRVRMLPGQVIEDWAAAGPRLAQTFAATECRVRTVVSSRQEVELWFLTHDPLTEAVPPFDTRVVGDPPDLTALPVALGEDGVRCTGCGCSAPTSWWSGRRGRGSPRSSGRSWLPSAPALGMGWCGCGVWTRRAGWSSPRAGGCSRGSSTATPTTRVWTTRRSSRRSSRTPSR